MLVASSENSGLNPMTFTDASNSLLTDRLQYQRKNGRFCDVEIVVNTRVFAAHRNILAAHSPYFDSIFKPCKITKEQVNVNSRHPAAFEMFLNYMYSGTVVIDRSSVVELLRFANNFLIFKLKNYCSEYLDRYLDAANCLSIRTLAQKYNLPGLVKAATDYFDSNLNRCLLESTDIIDYTYTQLSRLVQDPKYADVITSDTYLKLIVRWVGEKHKERDKLFRLLLQSCNFRAVAADTLEFLLDYSPLLSKSQKSRFLLLHVMEENHILMEKYSTQLETLRQQIKTLPELLDASQVEEEMYTSESDGDDHEEFVDGQPTSAQVIEYGDEMHSKLKMKIAYTTKNRKRPKTLRTKPIGQPEMRGITTENELIPWNDEDGIDGVFATTTLDGHTYGPVDNMDPDDVDEEEEPPDENGKCSCLFCGYRTTTEELLEKHTAIAHNRNTFYLCHLCEFETNWTKQFYRHCTEHWMELPYRCDECAYYGDNLQAYLTHRLTHTDERFFKCGECAWKGRTRSQLFAHERMHSVLDDRPLHCEECGRGFQQHAALDLHIATHNDVREMRCDDCGFMTKTADHLAMHRRQHTEGNFKCHIAGCDYSSTKKSQLAAHLRTHMAVRAHLCKVCGRGFIEKSHLVRHERIHLEEKPFKCEQCEYASSRRDKLKEHIIKHHNEMNMGAPKTQQRRKYKRQRMLAAANNMVNHPDVLFRPITTDDAVTSWQASNDFSYSPQQEYGGAGPSSFNPSPPRAYSETQQQQQHRNVPAAQSPSCMSMMNVPLGENLHQMIGEPSSSSGAGPSGSMNVNPMNNNSHDLLMTPTFQQQLIRSQDNRSAIHNPFNIPSTSDHSQRPTSLPTYGQMDLVQGLQAQTQQLQANAHLQQQIKQLLPQQNQQALPPQNQPGNNQSQGWSWNL